MNRTWILWAALGVLWVPGASMAAVSERDWKLPGDGLLTYDDVNRREWLDVTESLLSQFDGLSIEEKIENATEQFENGGLFEGFVLAKNSDTIALAQSAGIDTDTLDFATNQANTLQLIELLGVTYGTLEGRVATIGYLDDLVSPPAAPFCPCRNTAFFEVKPPTNPPSFAGLHLTINDDRRGDPSSNGLMLFRSVPEPTTNTLFISVSVLLFSMRRFTFPRVRV